MECHNVSNITCCGFVRFVECVNNQKSIEYHQTYPLNEQLRIWIGYGITVIHFYST